MNVVVKIDEKFVAMAAFVRIVKKCYEGKGVFRNPKAVCKIRKALLNPEHFCRLDINPEKVYEEYNKLEMDTDITDFDPCHNIDVDQLTKDILNVTNGIIDSPDDFGDTPLVNAGRFIDMVFDKTVKFYKEGIENFAPEKDDKYFLGVLDRELELHKTRNENNTEGSDKPNSVTDNKELIETIKNEVLSEITEGLPKAFEKAMFTNIKNVK